CLRHLIDKDALRTARSEQHGSLPRVQLMSPLRRTGILPSVSRFGEAGLNAEISESEGVRNMAANDGDNSGVRPACCAGGRASRTRGAGASNTPGVVGAVQAEDPRRIRTPRPSWSKRPASARRVVHVVDLGM